MEHIKLLSMILMSAAVILSAQTISSKKCNTCGKVLSQCQYKGKHPKPTSGYEKGHEWVDLGLSVKWATCNVGANSPSDYGGYYAWGETNTKSDYKIHYFFRGNKVPDSSMTNVDGVTMLLPDSGQDAARENWKGNWRMPTEYEFEELTEKCTWIWTAINGHNGYLIKGPNSNSIFLPAAGNRSGLELHGVGDRGDYWTNALYDKDATCLNFNEKIKILIIMNWDFGYTIRPVKD